MKFTFDLLKKQTHMIIPRNHFGKRETGCLLHGVSIVLIGIVIFLWGYGSGKAFVGISAEPITMQDTSSAEANMFTFEIPPGEVKQSGIRLSNATTESKTLHIYAVDAEVLEDGTYVCNEPLSPKAGAGSWLFSNQNVVGLAAKTEQISEFSVRVPTDTHPDRYNACIFLEEKVTSAGQESQEQRSIFRKGIPIRIDVPNHVIQKIDLYSFAILKKPGGHLWQNEMIFESKIHNKGVKPAQVDVSVKVQPLFGKAIGAVETRIAVPESDFKSWSFGIKPSMWGGLYRTEHVIEYPRTLALDDSKTPQRSEPEKTATTALNSARDLQIDITGSHESAAPTGSDIVRQYSGSLWFFVMPSLLGLLIECLLLITTLAFAVFSYRRWREGRLLECKICSQEVPFPGRRNHTCRIGKR